MALNQMDNGNDDDDDSESDHITLEIPYRTNCFGCSQQETEQQHISRRIDSRDDMLSEFRLI